MSAVAQTQARDGRDANGTVRAAVSEGPGRIVGHEPVGVIHALGPAVEGYEIGDRVLVWAIGPCGIRTLMELVRHGRLDLSKLITHRFPLAQIQDADELFGNQRNGVVKVAITP